MNLLLKICTIILVLSLTEIAQAQSQDYMREAWNYTTKEIISSLSVGDVDGDGRGEAIVSSSSEGFVRVFDGDGSILWEYSILTYVFTVVAADVDADGKSEVVVGGGSHVYMLNTSGELLWKYYVGNNNVRVIEPGRDGTLFVGTYSQACEKNSVFALDGNGTRKWIYKLDYEMPAILHAVSLSSPEADEVLVGFIERGVDTVRKACTPAYNKKSKVIALNDSGKMIWEAKTPGAVFDLAVDDINSDGEVEVFAASQPELLVLDSKGNQLWNATGVSRVDKVTTTDLLNDGKREVLFGSDNVYAYTAEGTRLWTAVTADRVYTLIASDLNNDGSPEVLAGSDSLYVFADSGEKLFKSKLLVSVGDLAVSDLSGDGMGDAVLGAVKQVILLETATAAVKQSALAFEQLALDFERDRLNESAIEYAQKARAAYLQVGDLKGTSRMVNLIDKLEGKVVVENKTSTSIKSILPPKDVEPADAQDIAISAKKFFGGLTPGSIKNALGRYKLASVGIFIVTALIVFSVCVVYLVGRGMDHATERGKTPKIEDNLSPKRAMRRGLVRGVERRMGLKI